MSRKFVNYRLGDWFLLPPDIRDWLPEGHLARFIDEIVDLMDLSAFILRYQHRTTAGRPPFHPGMMVKILLYSYATGRYSSRKIEAGIRDDLGLRYLAGGLTPDHSSLASFRERHVPELKILLILVLKLCKEMGLLELGVVAVDGTKLAANASSSQNVDTDKLDELIDAQESAVSALLEKARSADDQDPADPTKLPSQLSAATTRLEKLKAAKAAVARKQEERETKAREQAEFQFAEQKERYERMKAAREEAAAIKPCGSSRPLNSLREEKGLTRLRLAELTGITANRLWFIETMKRAPSQAELIKLAETLECAPEDILVAEPKPPGRALKEPLLPHVECAEVARVNLTDVDSSVMKPSTSRAFLQGFNPQVVATKNQFIVGAWVSTLIRDAHNLERSIQEMLGNTGVLPETVLADSGFFSLRNASGTGVLQGIKLLCPPERVPRSFVQSAPQAQRMREQLTDPALRAQYKKRSAMVEPVFAQIKSNRGFTRFSMRGLEKCSGEWSLLAAIHNVLKIFRLR